MHPAAYHGEKEDISPPFLQKEEEAFIASVLWEERALLPPRGEDTPPFGVGAAFCEESGCLKRNFLRKKERDSSLHESLFSWREVLPSRCHSPGSLSLRDPVTPFPLLRWVGFRLSLRVGAFFS